MFAVAVAAAVEREVETTSWPCALVVVVAIGMIAAVAVEIVVLPWALVVVMGVGLNAIAEGAAFVATGDRLVDVETVVWPWALVVVMEIAMAAAWLVVVMTLPWALVEVTVWGTSVTGALGVSWEKLVETATEPWALVVLCNTGIAATGAVETTMFPGSSVEVTAIGTIVAEGGLAAGAGCCGELFAAFGAC